MEKNASASLGPGSVVGGDYRLIRPLAKGSMGAVYLAEQQSTGAERAVKLMHGQLVRSANARERFMQEARIGAKLDSDHVVRVMGAGVDEDSGVPWMAMELLKGQDLGEMAKERGFLPPEEVLELFRQLCDGLGAAHQAGVVHRDLKLENVFIAAPKRADTSFAVKILDFGVSKVLQDFDANQTAAIGSPLWMSPEQARRGVVTPAADVWALGLIAFRLLTGKPYWKSAQVAKPSVHDVLMEVMAGPLDAPSRRVRDVASDTVLPAGFDAWFARCVVRDPTQRFANAVEAYEAMRAAWVEAPAPASHRAAEPPSDRPPPRNFSDTIVDESPWSAESFRLPTPTPAPVAPRNPFEGIASRPVVAEPAARASARPARVEARSAAAVVAASKGSSWRWWLIGVALASAVVLAAAWFFFRRH